MTNKRGVTLIELLAYISIVSIVALLITSTFSYVVRSYNNINGEGAIITEANFIMSNIITKANSFNPDYIRYCGDNCVELVIEKEKVIDPDIGVIVEVPVNKTVVIKMENNNIYIDNLKLNKQGFGVPSNSTTLENGEISFQCYDNNKDYSGICQKFVLHIKLAIVKVNNNEAIISKKSYIFENRFSF